MTKKPSAEKTVRYIRRATRRHYSAEEKIRIVLEGPRVGAERGPVDSAPGNHSHCFSNSYPMSGTRTVGNRVYGVRVVSIMAAADSTDIPHGLFGA